MYKEIRNQKSEIRNPRSGGFTVAEMMIVTIIVAILTTAGIGTYFDARDRFEFNNALTQMMGIIKTARNLATTSQPAYVPSENKYIVPASGYGIYINIQPASDEPHFTLFASVGDDDNDPETLNTTYDKELGVIPDVIIETYRLPNQAHFQYFLFDDDIKWQQAVEPVEDNPAYPTETEAVIMFRPPLADTFLGDDSGTKMEELGMRFINPNAPETSAKRCQYINVNRVKTFPILEYSDCSEYNT